MQVIIVDVQTCRLRIVSTTEGTKQEGINKKEEEKRPKYLMRCNQEGLEFKPFVLDSFKSSYSVSKAKRNSVGDGDGTEQANYHTVLLHFSSLSFELIHP
jgi:hypothetical protein